MLSAGEFLQQGKRTSGVRWPCNMRFTSATLASVLVMTQMLVAMPAIHLLGLERVYFDQNTAAPPELRKLRFPPAVARSTRRGFLTADRYRCAIAQDYGAVVGPLQQCSTQRRVALHWRPTKHRE
jgi:hypothetical protein